MPTANRRRFVPSAIELFLAQDYDDKELVIIDDGADSVADIIPHHPQIRYHREASGSQSLGGKRNLACDLSRGDVILHWDDDDWYAPWRISYQAECLIREDLDLCGLDRPLFVDALAGEAWEYTLMGAAAGWLCGATLGYRKSFWRDHRFPEIRIGEDTRFVRSARGARIGALPDNRCFLARIHAANTATKRPRGRWPARPMDTVRSLVGADWDQYFGSRDRLPLAAPPNKIGSLIIVASSSVRDIVRMTAVMRAAYYAGYNVDVLIASNNSHLCELLEGTREVRQLLCEPDDERRGRAIGTFCEPKSYDIAVYATTSLPDKIRVRASQRFVLDLDGNNIIGTCDVESVVRSIGWRGEALSPFIAKSTRRFDLPVETVAIHSDSGLFMDEKGGSCALREVCGSFAQVALFGAETGSGSACASPGKLDGPNRIHDFVGQLNLRDTAALLSQCAAVITADEDFMNVGIALCVPTFGLFRASGTYQSPRQSTFFEAIEEPFVAEATPGSAKGSRGLLGALGACDVGARVATALRARSAFRHASALGSRNRTQVQGRQTGSTSVAEVKRPSPSEDDVVEAVRDLLRRRRTGVGLGPKAFRPTQMPGPIPPEWYNQYYFERGLRSTWPRGYSWPWCGQVFVETAAMLQSTFPTARSYLDAGCGKGFLVRALFERGLEAQGFDHSAWAIANAEPCIRHLVRLEAVEAAAYGAGSVNILVAMSLLEVLTEGQIRHFLARAKSWVREAMFVTIQTGTQRPAFGLCRTSTRDEQWWCDRFAQSGWRRNQLREVVRPQHLVWRMHWATFVFEPVP